MQDYCSSNSVDSSSCSRQSNLSNPNLSETLAETPSNIDRKAMSSHCSCHKRHKKHKLDIVVLEKTIAALTASSALKHPSQVEIHQKVALTEVPEVGKLTFVDQTGIFNSLMRTKLLFDIISFDENLSITVDLYLVVDFVEAFAMLTMSVVQC
ncbi:hypothetical protein G4B88_018535 [Cannabis sativa]|uniref:Uncharacterized protein n=1 Tax=Cannabis sativa TaxID=3483 RepID=A0A7J6HH22_CANSA|nr:hypothetical protein G4B88_018535 [Cannabis sativa]